MTDFSAFWLTQFICTCLAWSISFSSHVPWITECLPNAVFQGFIDIFGKANHVEVETKNDIKFLHNTTKASPRNNIEYLMWFLPEDAVCKMIEIYVLCSQTLGTF